MTPCSQPSARRMLVGDAAFASTRASEPQVASRREQSCPHRLGNPCRKMPFGPRRKQGERVFFRASGHLAGHVFLQGAVDHACSPRSRTWCCTAPRPHAPLPPHAVSSQPPPRPLYPSVPPLLQAFPVVPTSALCFPGATSPLLLLTYGWRDLERCSPGRRCSPSSATYLGKDPFPITEKGHP